MTEQKSNPQSEPNINQTIAELLNKQSEKLILLNRCLLALADIAVQSGTPSSKIKAIVEMADYQECVWCKERGGYPSEYMKTPDAFRENKFDKLLDGYICDKCMVEFVREDTDINIVVVDDGDDS